MTLKDVVREDALGKLGGSDDDEFMKKECFETKAEEEQRLKKEF